MSVSEGFEAEKRPNFKQQLIIQLDKYGVLALTIFIFGACFSFIIWNAERFLDRADKQAEANLRVGQLEIKVEHLENDIKKIQDENEATPSANKN